MKSKRIAIIIVVAVVLAVGGYFGLMQFKDTTPVLAEGFGILQPEVEIRNVYPSWSGSAPLTILCGKDCAKNFTVTLEQPNLSKLRDGYEAFPEENYSWIHILPNSYQGGTWTWDRTHYDNPIEFGEVIEVDAGHYRQLSISLTMPPWSDYYNKQTEIRVRVSEVSTTGLVTIAVESRWYIITASLEQLS